MEIREIGWKHGTATVIVSDPSQHLQKNWLRGQFYERQMLRYIAETYGGGRKTFMDIGSSVGNHALFFGLFCTKGYVISVEPVLEALKLQQKILALNGLGKRMQLKQYALSNRIGRGRMEKFGPSGYSGMQRLIEGDEVGVTTLDALVGKRKISLIKIDVEYHEVHVIRGGLKTIERCRPVLFVECVDETNFVSVNQMLVHELDYRVGRRFNPSATYEFLP
jgi:FkbM family methyltransferase